MEYGHKIWLNEVEGGLVSRYRILDANPPDEQQWKPSLKAHQKTFKHPPQQASADRGLSSESNEQLAHELGVQRVIIPKRGYRSKSREKLEYRPWFVKGRHWQVGVEGRKVVLSPNHPWPETSSRFGSLPSPRAIRLPVLGRLGHNCRKLGRPRPNITWSFIHLLKNERTRNSFCAKPIFNLLLDCFC